MSAHIGNNFKLAFFLRVNSILHKRHCTPCSSFSSSAVPKKKLEDYFFDKKVQSILAKITGLDYDKVFKPKKQELTPHKFEFATDNQIKEMFEEARKKAFDKLQMPPVMGIRERIDEVLSKNPELQGHLETKVVFIDTSASKHARNRIMTVRETDGTLRKADWDERDRMNQIFFPLEGRSLETPLLFESNNLQRLLDEESYIFVLDAACAQFEPDDAEYHRVTSATYEHIKSKNNFDALRSTRHFGPMTFYFAVSRDIIPLLVDMVERKLISDAADTIRLLPIIYPELEISGSDDMDDVVLVQEYAQKIKSEKTAYLELALQSYLESSQSKLKEENVV